MLGYNWYNGTIPSLPQVSPLHGFSVSRSDSSSVLRIHGWSWQMPRQHLPCEMQPGFLSTYIDSSYTFVDVGLSSILRHYFQKILLHTNLKDFQKAHHLISEEILPDSTDSKHGKDRVQVKKLRSWSAYLGSHVSFAYSEGKRVDSYSCCNASQTSIFVGDLGLLTTQRRLKAKCVAMAMKAYLQSGGTFFLTIKSTAAILLCH